MRFGIFIVTIFSFFKRLFYFSPFLYSILVYIPLFTVINTNASKKSLRFVFIFSSLILFTGNIHIFVNFIPLFLLMIFKPYFEKSNFETALSKLIYLYVLVCLYGLYQTFFGYSSFELGWLSSGLGIVGLDNLITERNIRPFSTFAGIPEFSFFCAMFAYFFYLKKRRVFFITSIIMLIVAGSRGIIVSALIAFVVIFLFKKNTHKVQLLKGFFLSIIFFLVLVFIYPLYSSLFYESSSRKLVYGTFNGRIVNWVELIEKSDYLNFMIGNHNSTYLELTIDNLYLNLILKFGIFGLIFFFSFFRDIKLNEKSVYFLTIFLGYCLYADVIFSFYIMFPFFFAFYSKQKNKLC